MNKSQCRVCHKLLTGLPDAAVYCSARCYRQKIREDRRRDKRAAEAFEQYAEECSYWAAIAQPERNGEADQIT